uniref:thioredoxin-dependent peroxiredoxin n=1 Tax=Macrostomum lignano TaxID=282301 RepID=A0A1I8ISU5_9PLAT
MSHFLQPGDLAPPFRSQAVKNGEIVSDFTLEDAMRDAQYLLLVFYPSDFTFVCPTEVQQFADKWTELTEQLKCSTVCCSTDSAFTHLAWLKAPKSERGLGWTAEQAAAGFPVLLSDRTHEIARPTECWRRMLGPRTVGPDRRICQASISDMPVGRSVEEAVRLLTEMRAGGGGSLNGVVSGGGGGGGGVGGSGYQCEPQSFNVGQPVCSNLAVEAANLERQAAMLRVRDSEDRLAWMLAETERLRSEAERIRADTERLKNEARRREAEAERVMSCHSACQTVSSSSAAPVSAVSGSGGIAAMTPARAATAGAVDDCSWSTTGMLGAGGGPGCSAGVSQGYRPPPPPPPTQQQPQQQ